jgi:hypothetical protein
VGAILGANNGAPGRTPVNDREAHVTFHQRRSTATSGHGRRLATYGSEGWGFESLRARNVCPGQRGCTPGPLLDDLVRENILRTPRVLTIGGGHSGEASRGLLRHAGSGSISRSFKIRTGRDPITGQWQQLTSLQELVRPTLPFGGAIPDITGTGRHVAVNIHKWC